MSGVDGNGFTNKEILLRVWQLAEELSTKLDRIDREGSIGTRSELLDHEARIRFLERWKWWAAAAASVLPVGTLVAILLAVPR